MAIEFDGDFTVTASREEAYAVLSDPQKFAPLLPTYQDLTMKENGSADVTVKIGVGKIRGSAVVNLTLEESEAPVRAAYVGKGKVMGSAFNMGTGASLSSRVRLTTAEPRIFQTPIFTVTSAEPFSFIVRS